MVKFITLIGLIEVGDCCFETFPCQHYVSINGISLGLTFDTTIKKILLIGCRPDLSCYYHDRLKSPFQQENFLLPDNAFPIRETVPKPEPAPIPECIFEIIEPTAMAQPVC